MHDGAAALHIIHAVHEQMLAHARRHPALEVCGLLGGDEAGNAVGHYAVENVAADPRRRFLMQPEGQIAAMKRMRARGETLLAIYHSHPNGAAEPSVRDIDDAQYPDTWYLIAVLTPVPAVHAPSRACCHACACCSRASSSRVQAGLAEG